MQNKMKHTRNNSIIINGFEKTYKHNKNEVSGKASAVIFPL